MNGEAVLDAVVFQKITSYFDLTLILAAELGNDCFSIEVFILN